MFNCPALQEAEKDKETEAIIQEGEYIYLFRLILAEWTLTDQIWPMFTFESIKNTTNIFLLARNVFLNMTLNIQNWKYFLCSWYIFLYIDDFLG